jgi:hypothetical protein
LYENVKEVLESTDQGCQGGCDLVSFMEEMKNVYKILVGRYEGTRSFWRCKCRSEDNVKTDLLILNFQAACEQRVLSACNCLYIIHQLKNSFKVFWKTRS